MACSFHIGIACHSYVIDFVYTLLGSDMLPASGTGGETALRDACRNRVCGIPTRSGGGGSFLLQLAVADHASWFFAPDLAALIAR
jgi:hypothetical protein